MVQKRNPNWIHDGKMPFIKSKGNVQIFKEASSLCVLPPGRYCIGDPCYVIPEKDWEPLLNQTNFFVPEGLVEFKGHKMAVYSTAWGDGCYYGFSCSDESDHMFGVDAGLLGAVPEALIDEEAKECIRKKEEHLWVVVEEESGLICCREGRGLIHLGPLTIDTNDEEMEKFAEDWENGRVDNSDEE